MEYSQTVSKPIHPDGTTRSEQSFLLIPFHNPSILLLASVSIPALLVCIACFARLSTTTVRRKAIQQVDKSYLPITAKGSQNAYTDEKAGGGFEDAELSLIASDPYFLAFPELTRVWKESNVEQRQRMVGDKELYWKLQNVEDHPDVLAEARARLIGLLDQTLSEAKLDPANSILSLDRYEPFTLRNFLSQTHRSATYRYEQYLQRRREGGPREMFPSADYANEWLRLAGVVKYVDGGWLGGILSIGAGRAAGLRGSRGQTDGRLERQVSRIAWQVISEEFGDGDLQKNHVYLYETLLDKLKSGSEPAIGTTGPGNMRGFDGLSDDEGIPRCWEAAVAQQCIGALASTRDFFPEALGFNMAYEALPYHLLVSAKELGELKIDNYYFAIHVTIDNADSGHSAMARMAVERYLEGVLERDGPEAMAAVWRRVQAGYILAEGLPTTPSGPIEFEPSFHTNGTRRWLPRTQSLPVMPAESKLVDLVIRKAAAANKMHCTSRMLIGGETVEQWMKPSTLTSERALAFIRALSKKRPFVIPGEPPRSRLVRDLEWGGKMFGAFSRLETEVVRDWIRSLRPQLSSCGAYKSFAAMENSVESNVPVGSSPFERCAVDLWQAEGTLRNLIVPERDGTTGAGLRVHSKRDPLASCHIDFNRIRAVWYVSTSLFECFPLQPCKFATPLGMVALRLLRSQLGFIALHRPEDICSGTDDFSDKPGQEVVGLWDLGEKLDQALGSKPPRDIIEIAQETTDIRINHFCANLLAVRRRPYANAAKLMGINLAMSRFLHGSGSLRSLLSTQDQVRVTRIVEEQEDAISHWVDMQKLEDQEWKNDFEAGYSWTKSELCSILSVHDTVLGV